LDEKQDSSIGSDCADTVHLLQELNHTAPLRHLDAVIENMAISADAKMLLHDLTKVTLKIGTAVLAVGRAILSFALGAIKRYPNATFGLIVGATVAALVGGIPLVGAVLGPVLGKLLTALGLTMGAIADLKDATIRSEIAALERKVAIVAAGA
jgi:hypothetical protein